MAGVKKRSTLQVWGDVIFAIFLREIKSKFNDKLGVSWSVVSPVAFVMILSMVRGRMDGGDTHGVPTFFFMVYGLVLIQFFLSLVGTTSAAIEKNKALFAFRQVQPISSIIAVSGFEFLSRLFVFLVIYVIAYFLKMDVVVENPLLLINCFIQLWLIATSLGLIFALLRSFVPEIEKLRSLAMRPLFFISGAFFSLQDIPKEYWHWLDWNPILHAIELSRYAAYTTYGQVGVSNNFLTMITLAFVLLSLSLYQILWKQAISR
ncbi:ABC transporter permease [Vibrio crassostreae]|uniref:ABC transporter permease n=1 Tax=Vibrio crassostreae TaxID=246167 RepID=UPI001B307CC1|nr:ABC transporter permease [Vibrio crassostreae]